MPPFLLGVIIGAVYLAVGLGYARLHVDYRWRSNIEWVQRHHRRSIDRTEFRERVRGHVHDEFLLDLVGWPVVIVFGDIPRLLSRIPESKDPWLEEEREEKRQRHIKKMARELGIEE